MKRYGLSVVALLAALTGAGTSEAQSSTGGGPFSLGLGVGTNGALVEGAWRLSDQWVLRGQGAFLDFNYGFHSSDVHYGGKFHFNTGGGFLDWHPLSSPWLLTAGAIAGERQVDVSAKPNLTGTITIHGVIYPVTQVGAVLGKINYGDTAPVVGLGWDDTFYSRRGWGVRAIAGVAFGDHPPRTSLHAVGPFATNATVIADVQAEQASLQRQAGDYSYYPVVQIGLNYRF